MLDKEQLVQAFLDAGLAKQDTVLVHSALRRLGPVEGGADTIIDALLETVGSEGTVAFPTHTWSTVGANQPVFHEVLTPSIVGVLTNVARKRLGAVRSLHPTHSVAAIGPKANLLTQGHENDETPCSPTSPYGRLIDWQGKILLIGKGLECCTFFHCCEELAGCGEWSLTTSYETLYTITADGRTITIPSRRHTNGVSDNYPRLEAALASDGILKITHIGDCPLYCLGARESSEWLIPRLKENTKLLW